MRGRALVLMLVLATAGVAAGCGEGPRPNAQRDADPTLRPLPEGGAEVTASRKDPLFAEAAEEITDDRFDFEVRCWTSGDWNEILAFWGPELAGTEDAVVAAFVAGLSDVQLSPEVCAALTRFAYGPPHLRRSRPSPETALAVVVFAHEIGHTVIGSNEAATECWAVQRAKTVARVLGASAATGGTGLPARALCQAPARLPVRGVLRRRGPRSRARELGLALNGALRACNGSCSGAESTPGAPKPRSLT